MHFESLYFKAHKHIYYYFHPLIITLASKYLILTLVYGCVVQSQPQLGAAVCLSVQVMLGEALGCIFNNSDLCFLTLCMIKQKRQRQTG